MNRIFNNESSVWQGLLLALVSALAYSSSFVMTAGAIDESTSPVTMTLLRFSAVLVVLGVWLYRTNGFMPLLSRTSRLSWGVGVFHFLGNFAMMVAVTVAPVSVVIVLFYTFPGIVLLLGCLLDRRTPTVVELVTVVVAVVGVGLTVEMGAGDIPITGVALALGAAVCVSIMMLSTQRLISGASSIAVTWNLAAAAVVVAMCVIAVTGDLGFPATAKGWLLLALVMLLYPIALTCAVLAIGAAGAVTVALVLCTEPAITVILAVIFRDEILTPRQLTGIALVISAVIFLQLSSRRR